MIWESAPVARGVQRAWLTEAANYEYEARKNLRFWEGSNTVSWG